MQQPTNNPVPETAGIKVSITTAGSLVLLLAFFLPWIVFLGVSVPGHHLGEIWPMGKLGWAIPVVSAIAAILGFMGKPNAQMAQVAGGLPLILFAVAAYRFQGALFESLQFGAYLSLGAGLFLLCVAPRLKKPDPVPSKIGS